MSCCSDTAAFKITIYSMKVRHKGKKSHCEILKAYLEGNSGAKSKLLERGLKKGSYPGGWAVSFWSLRTAVYLLSWTVLTWWNFTFIVSFSWRYWQEAVPHLTWPMLCGPHFGPCWHQYSYLLVNLDINRGFNRLNTWKILLFLECLLDWTYFQVEKSNFSQKPTEQV